MTRIKWDQVGERQYETGTDRGVLFLPTNGVYSTGVPWNGLISVTESPGGAEATPQYADNIKYLNLVSAEEFAATIEAFTYPDEFEQCDGTASPTPGVTIGQQTRKPFGLAYRTLIGNDVEGTDFGYKIHLTYGALASVSDRNYKTVNDSPEALTFSWEVTTTPVEVPGFKPTATLTINSTKVTPLALQNLENIIYGSPGVDPRLPLPEEVFALFSGAVTEVVPVKPTQNANNLTIPTVVGVEYLVDGVVVSGVYAMTADTVVTALPTAGHIFPPVIDNDWYFDYV